MTEFDIQEVAIRFRWMWVGRSTNVMRLRLNCSRNPLSLDVGWKGNLFMRMKTFARVAIRFRWMWVGRNQSLNHGKTLLSRNPLSLDVGWKKQVIAFLRNDTTSRNPLSLDVGWKGYQHLAEQPECLGRNPLSLDVGWKKWSLFLMYMGIKIVAIRFRWMWVGSAEKFRKEFSFKLSQSAFAGCGLEASAYTGNGTNIFCRNPLSLDVGWKGQLRNERDGRP